MGEEFQNRMWLCCQNFYTIVQGTFAPYVEAEGLTVPQMVILFAVGKGNTTTIGKLSEQIVMNRGNCSTMCKRLEKAGLLLRERGQQDERVVQLSLTAKGQELHDRVLRGVDGTQSIYLAKIPPETLQAVEESMDQMESFLQLLMAIKEES